MGQFGGQPYFEGPIETKSRIIMPEYGDKELMLEMIRNKFNEEESQRKRAAANAKNNEKNPKMIPSEYIQSVNDLTSIQTGQLALKNEMNAELAANNNNPLSEERRKYYENKYNVLAQKQVEYDASLAVREAKVGKYSSFMKEISDNGQMKNYIADNEGNLLTLADLGFVPEGAEGADSPVTYEMANKYYMNEDIGYAGYVPDEFFTGAIDPDVYKQQRDSFLPQIEEAIKTFSSDKKADIEAMVKEGKYDPQITEQLSTMFNSSDTGGLQTVSNSFKESIVNTNNPVLKRAMRYEFESQKANLRQLIKSELNQDKKAGYEKELNLLNSFSLEQFGINELMVKSGGSTKLNMAIAREIEAYKNTVDYKKHNYTTSYARPDDKLYEQVTADIENYGSVSLDDTEIKVLNSLLDNPDMVNNMEFENPGTKDRIEDLRKQYNALPEAQKKSTKQEYLTKISNIVMLENADESMKEAVATRTHYFDDPKDPATGIHLLVNQQNNYQKAPLVNEQLAEFWPQLKVGTPLHKGRDVYMFGKKMALPFDNSIIKEAESYIVGATNENGEIESIIQMEVIVPIAVFAPWAQRAGEIITVPDEDELKKGRIKNKSYDLETFGDMVEKGNGDPSDVLGVYGYDFDSHGWLYNNTANNSTNDQGYTSEKGEKYVRLKIGIPVTEQLNEQAKKLYSNPTSARSTSTDIYNNQQIN